MRLASWARHLLGSHSGAGTTLSYHSHMQVYLVGGAVRDQLLQRPVKERDWVVVGASPQQMEQLGYRAVGRDFPVYLHPQTHEEYALARLERKVAPGYRGFTTQFSPEVTLEQDLERRDLTPPEFIDDCNRRFPHQTLFSQCRCSRSFYSLDALEHFAASWQRKRAILK